MVLVLLHCYCYTVILLFCYSVVLLRPYWYCYTVVILLYCHCQCQVASLDASHCYLPHYCCGTVFHSLVYFLVCSRDLQSAVIVLLLQYYILILWHYGVTVEWMKYRVRFDWLKMVDLMADHRTTMWAPCGMTQLTVIVDITHCYRVCWSGCQIGSQSGL